MSVFKDFVRRKLHNHEDRITNIEQGRIAVFTDIEDGCLYSQEFGVRIPLRHARTATVRVPSFIRWTR